MAQEKIKLGEPEILPSGKVRWQKMHKGRRWKSSAYDQDSRRNRSDAWQEFKAWQEGVQQDESAVNRIERKTAEAISLTHSNHFLDIVSDQVKISASLAALLQANTNQLESVSSPEDVAMAVKQIETRLDQFKQAWQPKNGDLSAGGVAEEYLSLLQSKAKSGQVSTGQYAVPRSDHPHRRSQIVFGHSTKRQHITAGCQATWNKLL